MRIEWLKKVCADGRHNAFTGMALYEGNYYLAFRSGAGHASRSSEQVIMMSADGKDWQFARRTPYLPTDEHEKLDYRDSHLLVCRRGLALYSCVTFGRQTKDGALRRTFSQVELRSAKGIWEGPQVITNDYVFWKPMAAFGGFFAAGYSTDGSYDIRLFSSDDGLLWRGGAQITSGGSETALYPTAESELTAFVRTESPPYFLQIYRSRHPFEKWEHVGEIPHIIQAPHLFAAGGSLYLAGRERPDYLKNANPERPSFALHRTKIWRMDGSGLSEMLELPSQGDTAYTGVVVRPDGSLLISYYSQHETGAGGKWSDVAPADIFVACIGIEQQN